MSSTGTRSAVMVWVLCAVQFVDVMSVTLVVTALPRMLSDLGASESAGGAVVATYAVCFGGLLMLAGRVADRIGHRRVLVWSTLLFAGASVVGWAAADVALLVTARGLQGVAAAASVPAALRLLTTVTPEGAPRRAALAGWSAAGALAGVSGFVLGGILTELASWRAVFAVGAVAGVVLAAGVRGVVPAPPPDDGVGVRVPWLAGVALTAAAAGLVAGPTLAGEHGSLPLGALVVVVGLAAGGLFVLRERRSRHRLVPPGALVDPNVRWGCAGSFVNTATTSSAATIAMLVLQDRLGLSPLRAAGVLVAFSVLVVATSALAPAVIARAGWARALALGTTVIAVGNAAMAVTTTVLVIGVGSALCGAGIGIASVAATDLGTSTTVELRSVAAALLNTAAQLGTALGTAAALAVARLGGPSAAWSVLAATAAVAAVLLVARAPARAEAEP